MDENLEPHIPILYDRESIRFPLDKTAFKEFIGSLLGQPEFIEGHIEGAFEIDFGKVQDIDNRIDNRIIKQNNSSLIEFKAKLFFNDGSSMSFNGIHRFLEYRKQEIRPLICDGFVFTWSYLVEFNDKAAPERQEISIFSVIEDAPVTQKSKWRFNLVNLFSMDLDIQSTLPKINYSVRATDRVWGIEITDLIRRVLSNCINMELSHYSKIRRGIIKNFGLIVFPLWLLLCFGGALIQLRLESNNLTLCRELSEKSSEFTTNTVPINEKVNFLIQFLDACNASASNYETSSSSIFLLVILGIIPVWILMLVIIYILIKLPAYRFILFTEESRKERDKYFRNQKNRKTFLTITIIVGLIVGVFSGIFANYIFAWLRNIF